MGNRFDLDNGDKKPIRGRRIGKKKMNREKIVMLGASVAVLGALTFTGVYLGTRGKDDSGEQRIDFSELEDAARQQEKQEQVQQNNGNLFNDGFVEHDDMDVDPDLYAQYKEANSEDILNPGLESAQNNEDEDGENEQEADGEEGAGTEALVDNGEADSSGSMSYLSEEEQQAAERETSAGMDSEAILQSKIDTAAETLQFDAGQTLAWPVVGNVLINYSMDGYVYFTTLGQYRYCDLCGAGRAYHVGKRRHCEQCIL